MRKHPNGRIVIVPGLSASTADSDLDGVLDDPLAFLIEHWESFAVLAYAGYLAAGRGLVLIDLADEEARAVFVSIREIDAPEGAWPETGTDQHVHSYDPEREVVFVVAREGKGVQVYHLEGTRDATPPAAYQRWRATTPVSSA